MIILTRLNGEKFAVNPDLLERVDTTPDTVLTLLDGTKLMVAEPLTVIIDEVRAFRASIIAASRLLETQHDAGLCASLAPTRPLGIAPDASEPDDLDSDVPAETDVTDRATLAPALPLRRSRRQ